MVSLQSIAFYSPRRGAAFCDDVLQSDFLDAPCSRRRDAACFLLEDAVTSNDEIAAANAIRVLQRLQGSGERVSF